MPPFGRLDVSMLVDFERAPYPSVTFRRQLQHPRPTADPSVPSSPSHTLEVTCPTPPNETVSYLVVSSFGKHIGRPEHKILAPVAYRNHFLRSLP
jgi:hypothetical protein